MEDCMSEQTDRNNFVDAAVKVRYAETDQMGIVYYANYLVWFEVGRGAWCKAKGFNYADMESKDGRYLMVAEASCRYKSPPASRQDRREDGAVQSDRQGYSLSL